MNTKVTTRGGSMSYLALASDILSRSGPLPFEVLYQEVVGTPGFVPRGSTPRNSLYSLLWRHSKGDQPDFRMSKDRSGRLVVSYIGEAR